MPVPMDGMPQPLCIDRIRLDGNGLSAADRAFYAGKPAVARFFATTVLPELAARRQVAESIDNALMDVAEDSF